jgi:hypothetical protein
MVFAYGSTSQQRFCNLVTGQNGWCHNEGCNSEGGDEKLCLYYRPPVAT